RGPQVMFFGRPVPEIMDPKIDDAAFLSAFHNAFAQRRATDIGKQCQNVDFHERKPSNAQPAFARLRRGKCATSNAESVEAVYDRRNKSSLTDRRYRLGNLLDDLENRALAVARGGAGEQCPNSGS